MRLIDADKLKKALGITSEDCNKCDWGSYESCGRGKEFEDICIAIDNAVTVDAVPVQRCDGCRYADWHSNGCIAYCTKHGSDGHVADSFCSEGEKDGDND